MVKHKVKNATRRLAAFALLAIPAAGHAQDRLKNYPGYDQYQRMVTQATALTTGVVTNVRWGADAKTFTYVKNGQSYLFDVTKKTSDTASASNLPQPAGRRTSAVGGQGQRLRGRQYETVISPDTQLTALYKNRNVFVRTKDGKETAVTTEGSEKTRLLFGSASWVYGEELDVADAMWWSPDSKKLAY